MRRLAILLVAVGGVLGILGVSSVSAQSPTDESSPDDTSTTASDSTAADLGLPPVDVLQVSGLIDSIIADEIEQAIVRASEGDAQALILQINSKASVIGRDRMRDLYELIENADVPVAIWVGPSGARATGLVAQLLSAADASGMAPGARIGRTGVPLTESVSFGDATETLQAETLGFQDARQQGALKLEISDEGAPTIRNMVFALDGLVFDGVELDTAVERLNDDGSVSNDITVVRFQKLGLISQMFHTAASPPVAYLFLIIGLALLVFEFFTAGIGVAGVVGAVCSLLGFYGLGELPERGWALAFIIASMVAFSIDVQVGIPRFWTGIGLALFAVGSWFLFPTIDQQNLRPSWLTLLVGIGGIALTFVSGMPSMTRTRFATPTIGRERLIGEMGRAVTDIAPDGALQIGGARWKARTNRATPVKAGENARVVAIDGVTLEVEPEAGGARDYRERRGKSEVETPTASSEQ
ncbi:MAG: NfeD family protein [Ilumatobacteraceae bacterium]